jgi:hypothetical protein
MKKRFVIILMSIFMFSILACKKNGPGPGKQQFNPVATKLVTLPAEYEAGDIQFDQDGYQVATREKKVGKTAVRVNSQIGNFYDEVRDPQFCKGLKSWAYIAKDGGKEFVVSNGKPGARYDAVDKLVLTPNGKVVYIAKKIDKWLLVLNNSESLAVDGFNDSPAIVSEGKQIAVAAQESQSKKQYVLYCSDNLKKCTRGNRYDSIGELRTDKVGSRLVYIAGNGGKKTVVSVDVSHDTVEKEGVWFDDVSAFDISDNGKYVAYLSRRGKDYFLVKDVTEIPVTKSEMSLDVVVSNTSRVLYVVMLEGKVLAYLDGKRISGTYDELDGASFSDDGVHYSFAVKKGDKHHVVVNGVEGPPLDMVVTPRFTPAGNRVVYRARDKGQRFVVIADERGRTLREHPRYDAVWETSFAPDGKSVGYGVKQGQELWWKVESIE